MATLLAGAAAGGACALTSGASAMRVMRRWFRIGVEVVLLILLLSGPAAVDRLGRVGGDLHVRAVVIVEAAVLIEAVFGHELRDLQGALGAVDVGDLDIGFDDGVRHL